MTDSTHSSSLHRYLLTIVELLIEDDDPSLPQRIFFELFHSRDLYDTDNIANHDSPPPTNGLRTMIFTILHSS